MPIEVKSKPQAIILDMDGVLADTEPIHVQAFRIMLNEYGINASNDFLNSFIGHSVENNIISINDIYFPEQPLNINETASYRDKIYLDLLKKTDLQPMPGIKNLIQFCTTHNITLALASSSVKEQIDMILSQLTLDGQGEITYTDVFASVVSGDMVKHKKPAKDIYQRTLDQLGLHPEVCIAIEDSVAGVQSAQAAGLKCFALINEYTSESDIAFADGRVESITEIVSELKKLI